MLHLLLITLLAIFVSAGYGTACAVRTLFAHLELPLMSEAKLVCLFYPIIALLAFMAHQCNQSLDGIGFSFYGSLGLHLYFSYLFLSSMWYRQEKYRRS